MNMSSFIYYVSLIISINKLHDHVQYNKNIISTMNEENLITTKFTIIMYILSTENFFVFSGREFNRKFVIKHEIKQCKANITIESKWFWNFGINKGYRIFRRLFNNQESFLFYWSMGGLSLLMSCNSISENS